MSEKPMKSRETSLAGAYLIEASVTTDKRGRSWKGFSRSEFRKWGLECDWGQFLRVQNSVAGTLRGLHWQSDPFPEVKMIECYQSRVFDVMVDLRPQSPTFGRWNAVELSPCSRFVLYLPPGVAHGYLTLEPDSALSYLIGGSYVPSAQRVLRWDDPSVGIRWPAQPTAISDRDANAPSWSEIF